jgi:hypothetical protein
MLSSNEAVFDTPFSLKTKQSKQIVNNFLVPKSFPKATCQEILAIIEAEKFARKYE